VIDGVIDEVSHSHIVQLCSQGKLDRNNLGDGESMLLETLGSLGIKSRIGNRFIEIDSTIDLLSLDQVQAQIGDSDIVDSFDWHYRLLTESTNADVLKLFANHQKPCIALAEMQTGGKGRSGRHWISPFARNIYCTIGIPRSIKAHNLGLISIVTGIGLCKALSRSSSDAVQLKWPNDIYYQNRKLGGILIESRQTAAGNYYFAIGIGINVSMTAEDLEAVPQPATSVNMIGGNSISRNLVLAEVIRQVVQMIHSFDESSILPLIEEFNDFDAFHNQRIRVTTSSQTIYGVNKGINHSGQLELETEQGRLQFSAADISLRGIE
jgi:BirA family biotin operon repressor/biotin-[acetyl-CoA-carboxylase] ligase